MKNRYLTKTKHFLFVYFFLLCLHSTNRFKARVLRNKLALGPNARKIKVSHDITQSMY